ncbi:hypothetical protein BC937DRAFT_92313 [Endogone sp. FLAS-F59071]|nr:hypothetical protein BC937DRAFT_92313 [Endogone sp. FLAS-F59071]|eukprot:RUS15552.1 hypothetical protein BC937DRAFT_92313 [Endogone sp. FLAS-F59071]
MRPSPFAPQHALYVLSLYKRILREASGFFDDRARTYLILRARTRFRDYKTNYDLQRVKDKIVDARQALHIIERANRKSIKDAIHILELAYGRRGTVRHSLLEPYLAQDPLAKPPPFISHIPHTAPPSPLSPPLKALILQHAGKKLEPVLPEPAFKPLHLGRKANLLWRHRTKILAAVLPPLPTELLYELERKASKPTQPLPEPEDGPSTLTTPDISATSYDKSAGSWALLYGGLGHPASPGRPADPLLLHRELSHLHPSASVFIPLRIPLNLTPLPPSPYANTVSSVIPSSSPPLREPSAYKPRQIYHMYRALLAKIPILVPPVSRATMLDATTLDSETMLDGKITYKVVLSDMAMGKTRGIVEEKDREGLDDIMMDGPVRKKKKKDLEGLDNKMIVNG